MDRKTKKSLISTSNLNKRKHRDLINSETCLFLNETFDTN